MSKLFLTVILSLLAANASAAIMTVQDADSYHSLELFGTDHAEVIGGLIGNRLQLLDESSANISGGVVNALYLGGQTPPDHSTANILSGAYINTYITTYGETVLNIYGGRMPDNYIWALDNSLIKMYVQSYVYDPQGGLYGDGFISGTWADDTTFEVSLYDPRTYSHITIHTPQVAAVPEPASVLIWASLGLGAIFMARRNRRPIA